MILRDEVKDALGQVQRLQQTVLDRQRFRGYSGVARILSGTMALVAAVGMAQPIFPGSTRAHVLGWGAVFIMASLLNGIALLYWFLRDPRVRGDLARLRPLLDSLPPLFVGGVLTAALILRGQHQYLFGIWMCMLGLSHIASRHVLPPAIILVGMFYLVCGSAWLLLPDMSFLSPWSMGVVFFAGEWAGGLILHFDERRYLALVRYQEPPDATGGQTDEP